MGRFIPDVDIDFAHREQALEGIQHVPATRLENQELRRHVVGVYLQDIPQDPLTGFSSIPYEEAEARGYYKVDFLNLNVYRGVRDEAHLDALLAQPPMWDMLLEESIVEQLFQLGGHFEEVEAYAPKSIMELAMFLAVIRPRKRHLLGLPFWEIEDEIWTPGDQSLYGFRKAHAVSYAHVIVVQMNLMMEQALETDPSQV